MSERPAVSATLRLASAAAIEKRRRLKCDRDVKLHLPEALYDSTIKDFFWSETLTNLPGRRRSRMIFTQLLSFIRQCAPNRKLSMAQRYWLSFCLMGILLANQVCWAAFARVGLGGYSQVALSWMFRHSKLLWPLLLHVSILLILNKYNITEGRSRAAQGAKNHRSQGRYYI